VLPALIERARREVALARVVGKFTVDIGIATLRRRIDGRPAPSADTTIESLVDLADDSPQIEPDAATSALRPDQLVLPDYDHLPAAHVVAKLPSLTQRERNAIEEYEAANRHRRTILGKLEQLRSDR
jgi:hypothetical protein